MFLFSSGMDAECRPTGQKEVTSHHVCFSLEKEEKEEEQDKDKAKFK